MAVRSTAPGARSFLGITPPISEALPTTSDLQTNDEVATIPTPIPSEEGLMTSGCEMTWLGLAGGGTGRWRALDQRRVARGAVCVPFAAFFRALRFFPSPVRTPHATQPYLHHTGWATVCMVFVRRGGGGGGGSAALCKILPSSVFLSHSRRSPANENFIFVSCRVGVFV